MKIKTFIDTPIIHIGIWDEVTFGNFPVGIRYELEEKQLTWELRGNKMKDENSLYEEIIPALQFPSYFGRNWDAFDECIGDLEWYPLKDYYFMFINNFDYILLNDIRGFNIFTEMLNDNGKQWATRPEWGTSQGFSDKPAVFRVIGNCTDKKGLEKVKKLLEENNIEYKLHEEE